MASGVESEATFHSVLQSGRDLSNRFASRRKIVTHRVRSFRSERIHAVLPDFRSFEGTLKGARPTLWLSCGQKLGCARTIVTGAAIHSRQNGTLAENS